MFAAVCSGTSVRSVPVHLDEGEKVRDRRWRVQTDMRSGSTFHSWFVSVGGKLDAASF